MAPLAVLRMAGACLAFVAGVCFAAPPSDLDRYAKRALETFEVPGMAIAIVEQGRPNLVRSYGVRRMGESAAVDEHTLVRDRFDDQGVHDRAARDAGR